MSLTSVASMRWHEHLELTISNCIVSVTTNIINLSVTLASINLNLVYFVILIGLKHFCSNLVTVHSGDISDPHY